MTRSAIGVDLGGTFIKAARITLDGAIDAQTRRPTRPESGPEGIADSIADMASELSDETGLLGLGIGVPGVTTSEGVVVIAPNLGWHHVPFKQILQDRLDLKVAIDNDANVAALAEARAGVGKGCNTLCFLTLGTGIGGGVILNGHIHHGASHSAGEIGHLCVLPGGPQCGCGNHGCLEALTSGPAMVRFVQKGLDGGQESAVSAPLTPEAICNAASEGDPLCSEAVAQVGRYLGIAIANLINVLSPDIIAIGGGISAAGATLMDPIVESAREHTLEGLFEHTRIVLATLGNDAGSLGAAFLVL